MNNDETNEVHAGFADLPDLTAALGSLEKAGVEHSQFAILLASDHAFRKLRPRETSRAAEGFMYGAAGGAVMGAILGWFSGSGTLVLPGLAVLIAAGPLMGALAGVGAAGLAGALVGAVVGLGMRVHSLPTETGARKERSLILRVSADNARQAQLVRELLSEFSKGDSAKAHHRRKPRRAA